MFFKSRNCFIQSRKYSIDVIFQLDNCLCQFREYCLQNVHSRLHKTNRTALHLAARYGKEECIGVLVKQGANIEAKDKDGQTAVALAAWKRHCNVIKILIKVGANRETAGSKYSKNIEECLKSKKKSYHT